jgi:hypothetical protein
LRQELGLLAKWTCNHTNTRIVSTNRRLGMGVEEETLRMRRAAAGVSALPAAVMAGVASTLEAIGRCCSSSTALLQ